MSGTNISASISTQNTFTGALSVPAEARTSVSVSGTFVATVTLQRRLDGANWRDVQTWTGEMEVTYVADESQDLRLGVKTGDYTSGTVTARLGVGG